MNILLIHPYIYSSQADIYLNEPLGLVCLASYLEAKAKKPRNIEILDLYARGYDQVSSEGNYYKVGISTPDKIVELVSKFQPDVIGVTCNFTTYSKGVFELVNLLKEKIPEPLLVMGGAHVTMDAENVLESQCKADLVVRGEGEETFNELIECLENKKDYSNLLGITFRKNGRVISNEKRPLIADLNELPIPNRKYIDQEIYSQINKKMYFLSKGKRVASIMTSRGCPFKCVFCSTKVVWERNFRPRSSALVYKEMQRLVKEYDIDEFLINDDQFYLQKDRVLELCDMLVKNRIRVHFNVASGSSVWLLDESLLKKLKKAGLYRITLPMESGNVQTLKYISKPINLDKARKMIQQANSLGLWTYANFIVGFPYETKEDIQATIDYVNKSGLDYATYFIAKPYAGSEMYEHFRKEGLLKGEIDPTTMGEVGHDIVHMSAEELQALRDKAQGMYMKYVMANYLSPSFFIKYLYPKINSIDGLVYFLKALKSSFGRFILRPILKKT